MMFPPLPLFLWCACWHRPTWDRPPQIYQKIPQIFIIHKYSYLQAFVDHLDFIFSTSKCFMYTNAKIEVLHSRDTTRPLDHTKANHIKFFFLLIIFAYDMSYTLRLPLI